MSLTSCAADSTFLTDIETRATVFICQANKREEFNWWFSSIIKNPLSPEFSIAIFSTNSKKALFQIQKEKKLSNLI